MAEDYYDILGVSKNASKEEIKKAYKKLAKKYHPDLNKETGSADTFKKINEAASVLGDEKKRSQYDQYGSAEDFRQSQSSGFSGDFSGFDFGDIFGGESPFDDLFSSFFGGRSGSSQRSRDYRSRGSDLRFDLEITLEEAAFGATKKIMVPKLARCPKCEGKGAESESDISTCGTCHGTGQVNVTRRTPFGIFSQTTACGTCGGSGKHIKNACSVCGGDGRIEKTTQVEVKIPAGVDTGTKLRLSGQGEAGEQGGPAGDLFVVIIVKKHDTFIRKGNDVILDVPITISQAALGDTVSVPTLDGKVNLKVPSGTQSHTTFRVKGKGLPDIQGYGLGNELVRVIVEIPAKVSKRQKELLEEFGSLKETKVSKKSKNFFSRLKDAFVEEE